MNVGTPYKQARLEDSYDTIVIGSGIGGLAAAALAARHAGERVLVLERHYVAGGFTHVFHRPNYEWDVGVHYIGEVGRPDSRVRAAFDHVTEGRLEWACMPDVYDRFRIGDQQYGFPSGEERLRAYLKGLFPKEGSAIDAYLGLIKTTAGASGPYFAEKAVPSFIAGVAGGLMRRAFLRNAGRTTMDVVSELTSDRELIGLLTAQWPDYGLPPAESSFGIHSLIAAHYLEGGFYPVGGAASIAASIAPVIERGGGQIVTSAEVSRILVNGHRATGVALADGREIHAKTIYSDAGAGNTFLRLLDPALSGGIAEELKAMPASMAHVCLYVGVNGPVDEAANLWIYQSADHDASMATFTADTSRPFPVVFISFPSSKDPDFARRHPGRSTIEVVAPLPFEVCERWADTKWKKRGADYEAWKKDVAGRLKNVLEEHVPSVRARIDYAELSTPLSTRHFANYPHGEIYGLPVTPARFESRWLGARTPIRSLYLTGQDAAGPGVTGALFGAICAASAALGKNLISAIRGTTARSNSPRVSAPAAQAGL